MKKKDGKKILVIDDEPDVVAYLSTLLEDNGFDIITAKNGEEGLQKAKKEKPDLISLDISMPEKSGVKFFRELQEDTEISNIPVIIVTGVSQDFEKFIKTRKQVKPPAGYVSKPIDQQDYLGQIKKILNIK
ncbi:response regulator [bacterium]|nr:response regulator [bacterium]